MNRCRSLIFKGKQSWKNCMTMWVNIQELGPTPHKSERRDMPSAIVTLFSTALHHVTASAHCNALAIDMS